MFPLYFAHCLLCARGSDVKQQIVVSWLGAVGFCAPLTICWAPSISIGISWEFQVVRNVGAQTPPKSSLEDNIWSLSFSPSKAACVFEGHMPAKATASVPGTWPGRQSSFTIYLPLTQISITMEETPFLGKGLSKPAVCLVDHGRSFCFSWRCGFLRPVLPSVALNYARWRRTVWFPSSSSHPLNICFSTCLW